MKGNDRKHSVLRRYYDKVLDICRLLKMYMCTVSSKQHKIKHITINIGMLVLSCSELLMKIMISLLCLSACFEVP